MPQLDFLMYSNIMISFINLTLVIISLFFIYTYLFFSIFYTYYFFINSKFNFDNFRSYLYFIFNIGVITEMPDEKFIELTKTTSLWSEDKSLDVPYWGEPIIKTSLDESSSSVIESIEWGYTVIKAVDNQIITSYNCELYDGLENFGLVEENTPISDLLTHTNSIGIPDAPSNLIGFQNPGSLDMAAMICIHNDIYYYLQYILFLVFWFLSYSVYSSTDKSDLFPIFMDKYYNSLKTLNMKTESFDACTLLEIIWTVVPSFCLLLIGYPGISLLYSLDEQIKSDFFVKIIGHQWYWTYEYPEIMYENNRCFKYDSVIKDWNYYDILLKVEETTSSKSAMINFKMLKKFYQNPEYVKRYIYVNAPLYVVHNMPVTAIVTSSDVIHSWAVPALGVKIDACPGRLNQIQFQCNLKTADSPFFGDTYYWGQCSEFCGIGHGFMPILVRASSLSSYFDNIIEEFIEHKVIPSYQKNLFGPYPSYIIDKLKLKQNLIAEGLNNETIKDVSVDESKNETIEDTSSYPSYIRDKLKLKQNLIAKGLNSETIKDVSPDESKNETIEDESANKSRKALIQDVIQKYKNTSAYKLYELKKFLKEFNSFQSNYPVDSECYSVLEKIKKTLLYRESELYYKMDVIDMKADTYKWKTLVKKDPEYAEKIKLQWEQYKFARRSTLLAMQLKTVENRPDLDNSTKETLNTMIEYLLKRTVDGAIDSCVGCKPSFTPTELTVAESCDPSNYVDHRPADIKFIIQLKLIQQKLNLNYMTRETIDEMIKCFAERWKSEYVNSSLNSLSPKSPEESAVIEPINEKSDT